MKIALLVACLYVIAAVLVTFWHPSATSFDRTTEYIPTTTVGKPPCRWDDLCNGYVSPARLEAHKHDKETP